MTTDEIMHHVKDLEHSRMSNLSPQNDRLLERYTEVNVQAIKEWMKKEWLRLFDTALLEENIDKETWRKNHEL